MSARNLVCSSTFYQWYNESDCQHGCKSGYGEGAGALNGGYRPVIEPKTYEVDGWIKT